MNIFAEALKIEKEGEELYRRLEKIAAAEGLKKIFSMLAEDEIKHYNIFKEMEQNVNPSLADTKVLTEAKNVLSSIKDSFKEVANNEADLKEVLNAAVDSEIKAQAYYEKQAKRVDNDAQKLLLLTIANEEKQHQFLLDNLLEFLRRPENWLENAEWNHLEKY
jgi:rubrerythrin